MNNLEHLNGLRNKLHSLFNASSNSAGRTLACVPRWVYWLKSA